MSQPTPASTAPTAPNLDPAEIERFSKLASEWWDPNGKFRPLHKIGPPRIQFVRDEVCRRLGRKAEGLRPLSGLTLLDIGCGGGLVCEPMARMGATVIGVDPAAANIAAATKHAEGQGLTIDYRAIEAEQLIAEGRTFDAVLCLEVAEHVPDPAAFLKSCGALVRPWDDTFGRCRWFGGGWFRPDRIGRVGARLGVVAPGDGWGDGPGVTECVGRGCRSGRRGPHR